MENRVAPRRFGERGGVSSPLNSPQDRGLTPPRSPILVADPPRQEVLPLLTLLTRHFGTVSWVQDDVNQPDMIAALKSLGRERLTCK